MERPRPHVTVVDPGAAASDVLARGGEREPWRPAPRLVRRTALAPTLVAAGVAGTVGVIQGTSHVIRVHGGNQYVASDLMLDLWSYDGDGDASIPRTPDIFELLVRLCPGPLFVTW